jgi:hypothetical protein
MVDAVRHDPYGCCVEPNEGLRSLLHEPTRNDHEVRRPSRAVIGKGAKDALAARHEPSMIVVQDIVERDHAGGAAASQGHCQREMDSRGALKRLPRAPGRSEGADAT